MKLRFVSDFQRKAGLEPSGHNVFAAVLITVFFCLQCAGLLSIDTAVNSDSRISAAHTFLERWLQGDEPGARQLATSRLNQIADETCDQAMLIYCQSYLVATWGNFEYALYENTLIDADRTTVRFLVSWTDQGAWVVVLVTEEDGQWLVDGWRGFLTGDTTDADLVRLMNGSWHLNEFPPIE